MKIIISGAIANFNEISNKQLLENLKTKIKGIEFYELQFKSGGNHSGGN